MMPRNVLSQKLIWDRCIPEPNSGCWLWAGAMNKQGYGEVQVDGKKTRANRASLEAFKGPLLPGQFACHHCDNKACVNPDHLFAGYPLDNVRDMYRRGLAGDKKGGSNPKAKLAAREVAEIRAHKGGATALAAHYGVTRRYINKLRRGINWPEVPKAPLIGANLAAPCVVPVRGEMRAIVIEGQEG
jgi:hypothetical protein